MLRTKILLSCLLSVGLLGCASTQYDRAYQQRLQNTSSQSGTPDWADLTKDLYRSERFSERISAQNLLLDNAETLAQENAPCQKRIPFLQQALQQNFTSLLGHYLLAQCAAAIGDDDLANRHEALVASLVQEMVKAGRGESAQDPIFLPVLRDASSFLLLGGFTPVSSYFDLSVKGGALHYVVLVNDGDGKQRTLHFDVTLFMQRYFVTAFDATNSDPSAAVGSGLRVMADGGDAAAQIAVGDLFFSFKKPERASEAMAYYRKAADQGNVYAMARMGWRYLNGEQVNADTELALQELARAAERGYVGAEVRLAQLYDGSTLIEASDAARDALLSSAGKRVGLSDAYWLLSYLYGQEKDRLKNDEKAFYWAGKAADMDHVSAMNAQAVMWEFGIGTRQDETKAVAGYRRAASMGNAAAMSSIGRAYRDGKAVSKDPKQAVEWFEKAEQAGSAFAAYALSEYYSEGEVVAKDVNKARALVQTSAERGHAEAMCKLGYLFSEEGPAQWQNALKWYLSGATEGQGWCAYNLGWEFSNGKNVPRNSNTAFQWYALAAERDYLPAFATIGWMLKQGDGTPVNYAKALEYLKKGMEKNDPLAITNLASMYYDGHGVDRDYTKAFELYQQAAQAENKIAQRMVGRMYRDGLGVAVDLNLAKQWLQRAAAQGDKYAETDLQRLNGNAD